MRPFKFDVETTELTDDECVEFATLVQSACHMDHQHKIAIYLAMCVRPQLSSVQDVVASQVVRMWRTELRV